MVLTVDFRPSILAGMELKDIVILYQDHHLLIVNKPAGVVIHPTYKHTDGQTLWDHLLLYLQEQGGDDWTPPDLPDDPQWAGAPEAIRQMLREKRVEQQWKEEGLLPRPCLLHRLDKDTSGVVALARTEKARRHISNQFHRHTIEKRYLAVIAHGAPEWAHPRADFHMSLPDGAMLSAPVDLEPYLRKPESHLVLDGALQRDPDDRRRCIVGPDGQHAVTRCRVLIASDRYTLLEVLPVTGRTHQIRGHLAALGYAIVGDPVYGVPEQAEGLKRQFLHAASLRLTMYPGQQFSTFKAPLSPDLLEWLERHFSIASGVFNAE